MKNGSHLASLEAVGEAWEAHEDEVQDVSFWTMARAMPAVFARVLRESWAVSRRDTLILSIGTVLAEVLTAVGLVATAGVLENLLLSGPTPDRVRAALPALLAVVGAIVLRAALRQATSWASQRLSPQLTRRVSLRLVNASTEVELVAFDDADFRDSLHRVTAEAPHAVTALLGMGTQIVASVFSIVAVGGVLTVLHPILLPLLVLAIVPVWWTSLMTVRMAYRLYDYTSGARRRMDTLYELMTERRPAAEIRSYTMRSFLIGSYERVSGYVLDKELKVETRQAAVHTIGDVLGGLGVALVYVALGGLLYTGRMELAVAGTAVIAIRTALSSMQEVSRLMTATYEKSLYYQDYVSLIAEAGIRAERSNGAAPSEADRITMRGVVFSYPSGDEPALRGVDVDIEPGQIIALVGENGSGKSTLAKLIGGLYTPQEGRIEYGGVSHDDVDVEELRERIAVVAQDFTHWPLTAGENITIGRTGRPESEEQFQWAIEASGADRVLTELPRGAETLLDPSYVGGVDLSGGQWQRIAVARGFYRDAPLLICDEPTAALDARTEHEIFETIRNHAAQRTVVLITHRLANVRYADKIYVMDRGRVADSGTQAELMSRDGIYREFYTLQADAYRDAEPDDRPEDQPDEG